MLETKCVGDNLKMLVTLLAHWRRAPTSKWCHQDLNSVASILKLSTTSSHQHQNVTNMTIAVLFDTLPNFTNIAQGRHWIVGFLIFYPSYFGIQWIRDFHVRGIHGFLIFFVSHFDCKKVNLGRVAKLIYFLTTQNRNCEIFSDSYPGEKEVLVVFWRQKNFLAVLICMLVVSFSVDKIILVWAL